MSRNVKDLLSEIMRAEFHKVSGSGWDAIFEKLMVLLATDDPEVVDLALERTASALWYEKYMPRPNCGEGGNKPGERLSDVLATLGRRPDVSDRLLTFVRHTRLLAKDNEFRMAFRDWLDDFRPTAEAAEEWDIAALAARIRVGAFGGDWATASPHLTNLLDHPSRHVRACAAATLGELIADTGEQFVFFELMKDIHDRELERPGIAGPFYGCIYRELDELAGNEQAYVKNWMLSILENRKAPEPDLLDFHFNGIDFHAHELFSGDPEGVRELIRIGRMDIAVAAASDENERIEGMENVLIELGNSDDSETCRRASWHLAYCYRVLHQEGKKRGFVSMIDFPDGEALFLNGHPESPRFPYSAVLYPSAGESFSSDEIDKWIDRLLPPDIRGEPKSFYPCGWHGETIGDGQVSRNKVYYSWECGAVGNLKGDVAARDWHSLTIIWHGEEKSWTPAEYLGHAGPGY